jgi:hypothetical protein
MHWCVRVTTGELMATYTTWSLRYIYILSALLILARLPSVFCNHTVSYIYFTIFVVSRYLPLSYIFCLFTYSLQYTDGGGGLSACILNTLFDILGINMAALVIVVLMNDETKMTNFLVLQAADLLSKRPRADSGGALGFYPQKPGEKLCAFYMTTRTCNFGLTCKFDHPQWVPYGGIPNWKEVSTILYILFVMFHSVRGKLVDLCYLLLAFIPFWLV